MLQDEYLHGARDMTESASDEVECDFDNDLENELVLDKQEDEDLEQPDATLLQSIDDGVLNELAVWEYFSLDEDGGTTNLTAYLTKHENAFVTLDFVGMWLKERWKGLPENGVLPFRPAFEKYGHLAPPDFFPKLQASFSTVADDSNTGNPSEDTEHSDNAPYTPPLQDTHIPGKAPQSSGTTEHNFTTIPMPPSTSSRDTQSWVEQQLATENANLRKRIAKLEAAGNDAKRWK